MLTDERRSAAARDTLAQHRCSSTALRATAGCSASASELSNLAPRLHAQPAAQSPGDARNDVRARMGRAWHVFVKSKKKAMFRVLRKHPFISRRCPPLSRGEYNRAYIVVKLLFTSHCTGVPLSFTTHFLTYDGDCTQRTLDVERRYIDSRTLLSLRRLVLQRAPETELPARNPRPTPLQTVKLTCRSCRCSCGST